MFQSGIEHHHEKISSGACSVLVGYAELGAVRLSVVIPRKCCFTFVIVINRPLEFLEVSFAAIYFHLSPTLPFGDPTYGAEEPTLRDTTSKCYILADLIL